MTRIQWTDETWNPVTGGVGVGATTGVTLHPDRLDVPLRWRKPRRVFVNSMSDLFHDSVPDEFIARIFRVMAYGDQHVYQILTKRPARMQSLLNSPDFRDQAARAYPWPLPNVWLGVSVENQRWADIRIPALLETPAAVRWISAEPLLGPLDLGIGDPHRSHDSDDVHGSPHPRICLTCSTDEREVEYFRREPGGWGIDWVVCGGESGPGARPMHPDWARSLRDQCQAAGVPFFFKQWGEWAPNGRVGIGATGYVSRARQRQVGDPVDDLGHRVIMERFGKKAAGRMLDGREWNEYPTQGGAA